MNLHDTVAIVTGGSGGLGGRICHALAKAGVNIAILYNTRKNSAEKLSNTLSRDTSIKTQAYQCDVTNALQIEEVVASVLDSFGRIDILINDAAFNKLIDFSDLNGLTYETWQKIIDVNLTGPMLFTKAVADPMRKQDGGRIVNISSNAGFAPRGSSIAYSVSKAALNHLTKCMAVALAPDILVNCVAPGYLEGTKMSSAFTEEHVQAYNKTALLHKPPHKDDVADQVLAFCSTNSVTGQTLVVDSGMIFH